MARLPKNMPIDTAEAAFNRKLRIVAGLTQDEIATRLGISPSLWSRYERGKVSLPYDVYRKINYALEQLPL